MKKILLLILLLLLCGCQKSFINYSELYKKMNSYDSYTLALCNNDCENIEKITQKNKINIYYMDVKKLNENEKIVIETQFFGGGYLDTPSIVIIEKGVLKNRLSNNLTDEKIYEFFKSNRIVEE